jgi:hypothetical protein
MRSLSRTAPLRCRHSREKGPTAKRRASKARRVLKAEQAVKRDVLALDGHRCRWPGCDVPRTAYWGGLEAAHYKAEGIGGDPNLVRCTPENLLAVCQWHHQGPRGLHSPYASMKPRDETLGMRGRVAFYRRTKRDGPWYFVGETAPP